MVQSMIGDLLFINRLWKDARAETVSAVSTRVTRFLATFSKACVIVGRDPRFAKSHELLHITHDMLWHGSGVDTSAGEITLYAVLTSTGLVCFKSCVVHGCRAMGNETQEYQGVV